MCLKTLQINYFNKDRLRYKIKHILDGNSYNPSFFSGSILDNNDNA